MPAPAPVEPEVVARLRDAFGAFGRGDLDAVLAGMHPDVDWPDLIAGTRIHGHAAVRAYWEAQLPVISPAVELLDCEHDDQGRIVASVHQVVRNAKSGELLSDVTTTYILTMADGLILAMDVLRPDGRTYLSAPQGPTPAPAQPTTP